jgi:hypothetical protein
MKSIYKIVTPIIIVALMVVGYFSAAFAVYDSGFNGGPRETEIVGTVDHVTETSYIIDGESYPFTSATEVEGLIEAGSLVKVHLYSDADGNFTIREIELAVADDLSDDNNDLDDVDMYDDDDSYDASDDDMYDDMDDDSSDDSHSDDSDDDDSNDDSGSHHDDDDNDDDDSNDDSDDDSDNDDDSDDDDDEDEDDDEDDD